MTQEKEIRTFEKLYQECLYNGKLMFPGRLLWRAAQLHPNRTALIYQDKNITYKELYARVCAMSRKLIDIYTIKPRDKVIICYENSPEFYIIYCAVWHIGAVVVPLNTFLKETELTHIVTDAQPQLIFTSVGHVALFEKSGSQLPPIITEVDLVGEADTDVQSYKHIDLEPEELAALLYTSGTTGLPKGVMLSSKNIMTNVLQIATLLGETQEERILGVLPLFHSFAQNTCVWASLFYGLTIILVSKIDRKAILEGLSHKPTIFLGVPALYGLLCLMKNAPLDSVRLFISGGDALPDKIRAGFSLLYRRKIVNGYGLTETSPVISVNLSDYTLPTNCIGRPVVGIECSIRNKEGKECDPNTIGVLWVKGDNVMMGYYKADTATAEILQNGWFNTGDLAYKNDEGMLIITGREKDLIIHKGFNIYPQEIENVLLSHPNVIRVAVVGKQDQDGEVPVAFVQLRIEQVHCERELRSLCMKHLASYKVPKQYFCDTKDLPATATGKIDKKVLRSQLLDK